MHTFIRIPSGKSNEGSKNADFPPHYIDAMVKQGMSKGLLISGTLRINPRAFEDAFLTSTDYNDVYINGVMNRNRALHGDEVGNQSFNLKFLLSYQVEVES